MINSVKTFFKLIGFEIKKIVKSPIIFIFLLLFPFIISLFYGVITNNANDGARQLNSNTDICFVCENVDNLPDISDAITEIFGENAELTWKTDLNECVRDLQLGYINLIVYVDNTDTNNVKIIYDDSSTYSTAYKDTLVLEGYKYSYYTIKDLLNDAGVSIDGINFNLEPLSSDMSILKSMEPTIFAMVIAFVLIIGISYTMARDNETGVMKQLSYTPMSINKYLFVRWTFFLFLSILQSAVIILTINLFGVNQMNRFLGLMGISMLFGMAFTSLSLMLATSKNQISTISLAIVFILLPIIIMLAGMNKFSVAIKIILYISPLTPFILSFKSFLNFGVLDYTNLLILIIETIIYFIFASFILNKKYGKKIKLKNINKN